MNNLLDSHFKINTPGVNFAIKLAQLISPKNLLIAIAITRFPGQLTRFFE
jgi:hypothetical protein